MSFIAPNAASGSVLELPSADAVASAKHAFSATTHATSAVPKLIDGPTVAEDVQTPRNGVGLILNATSLKAASPAYIPTVTSRSVESAMSPPLSTMA